MSRTGRVRAACRGTVGLLTAGLVVAAAAACASMPTSGEVIEGGTEVSSPVEVGFNVQGPATDADPGQIVQGFFSVAQLGPASVSTANVAREYVQPATWADWDRYARVLVLSQYPEWVVEEYAEDATTTTVTGQAEVVATLDDAGVYTELPEPSSVDVTYELVRDGEGQWRISGMEDGMLVQTNFLSDAFHRTTLYYPTSDFAWWVPDVRWFPAQSWRTEATQEILAGPPTRLAQSAVSVVPEGTTLALDAVTIDDEGVIDVSVTSAITSASAQERSLIVAQLSETLRDGEGRSVTLSDGTSPLAVSAAEEPARPSTVGDALAVVAPEGEPPVVRRVVGRELTETAEPLVLDGIDPTAVAAGPDGTPVVVRDGSDRIVRVTDGAPVEVLRGDGVVAPSVDRFATVWSAVDSSLWAVLADGTPVEVPAEWVGEHRVRSLRVSPEGARVVVVLHGSDGPEVWVAGIERDAQDVPTGLAEPVRVGAPIDGVVAADWYEESTLVLLGRGADGTTLYLAGVGGLAGTGTTRVFNSPPGLVTVASGVGASPTLAVDGDGTLQARQSGALWPTVSEDVVAVAYPG